MSFVLRGNGGGVRRVEEKKHEKEETRKREETRTERGEKRLLVEEGRMKVE